VTTVDVPSRGLILKLYDAARKAQGKPLTLLAAESLKKRVRTGDIVLVTTGFIIPPRMVPDTDGPPGTSVLARVLDLALGAKTVVVTEAKVCKIITATARAAGLIPAKLGSLKSLRHAIHIREFPVNDARARSEAETLINELKPAAVIAIEKTGRNDRGVYHNMRGLDVSSESAKVEHLFKQAEIQGIPTVGVGDGGNEVGMGKIKDAVRKNVRYGDKCRCPCGAGIAAAIETDVLVVATVSNWGAYGVSAMLAAIEGKQEIMHTKKIERRILRKGAGAGAIDGVTGFTEPSVDGLSEDIHAELVNIIGMTLQKGMA